MKLKDLLEQLNQLAKERPEALEMEVVYSSDEEGNNFDEVRWTATLGKFNYPDFDSESENPNAVCIN